MGEPLHEFEHGYTCKEVVELASEYVEGAMAPDEAVLFELHLNFCDGCYTFVDQVRAAAALAGRLAEEQVPEETRLKLVDAFRDWRRE